MSTLALRVLAVAIPSRGGQDTGHATDTSPDASAAASRGGLFRFLLALPAVYLDAAKGLRADPPWASRPYVPDPAVHRAHDIEVARLLLAKHGRSRLAAMFPAHAALLGIEAAAPQRSAGDATVTVTVVDPAPPARLALPAARSTTTPAPLEARPVVEVAR